jgi:hypothetical protein
VTGGPRRADFLLEPSDGPLATGHRPENREAQRLGRWGGVTHQQLHGAADRRQCGPHFAQRRATQRRCTIGHGVSRRHGDDGTERRRPTRHRFTAGRSTRSSRHQSETAGQPVAGCPPSPHRLPGARGLTPSVLLPAATAWTVASAGGQWGLRLPSPSSLAGPRGSPVRALRVGSRRGATLRTARRGAASAWMRRATGLTCSGRSSYPDHRTPEPLIASAPSPEFPPELVTQGVVETENPDPSPARPSANIGSARNHASADISSAYAISCVRSVDR